jgi:hypothetical protein
MAVHMARFNADSNFEADPVSLSTQVNRGNTMGLVPEHEFKGFRYRFLMPDYDRQHELCVGQLKQ